MHYIFTFEGFGN